MKNISSMRFLAFSFEGIFALILCRENPQQTLNISENPNLGYVLKNTLNKKNLRWFIAECRKIGAYRLKTISKMPTWWKQISKILTPSEISLLNQFCIKKKTDQAILQEISREEKYYMTVLMNIKYFECCCGKRVWLKVVVGKRQWLKAEGCLCLVIIRVTAAQAAAAAVAKSGISGFLHSKLVRPLIFQNSG